MPIRVCLTNLTSTCKRVVRWLKSPCSRQSSSRSRLKRLSSERRRLTRKSRHRIVGHLLSLHWVIRHLVRKRRTKRVGRVLSKRRLHLSVRRDPEWLVSLERITGWKIAGLLIRRCLIRSLRKSWAILALIRFLYSPGYCLKSTNRSSYIE